MLRVGIVGMGFGAAVHLPAFDAQTDVEVVAVADNGSGRAKDLAAKRGGKLRAFNDGVSLAAWDGIDIVSIAVPPGEQEALVRAALVAGKHVLCEKPFGTGSRAARDLAQLAGDRRLVGALCYEFRYDPGVRRLIELIDAGEIGTVRRIVVSWQTSGALDPQRVWSWRSDAEQGGDVDDADAADLHEVPGDGLAGADPGAYPMHAVVRIGQDFEEHWRRRRRRPRPQRVAE